MLRRWEKIHDAPPSEKEREIHPSTPVGSYRKKEIAVLQLPNTHLFLDTRARPLGSDLRFHGRGPNSKAMCGTKQSMCTQHGAWICDVWCPQDAEMGWEGSPVCGIFLPETTSFSLERGLPFCFACESVYGRRKPFFKSLRGLCCTRFKRDAMLRFRILLRVAIRFSS